MKRRLTNRNFSCLQPLINLEYKKNKCMWMLASFPNGICIKPMSISSSCRVEFGKLFHHIAVFALKLQQCRCLQILIYRERDLWYSIHEFEGMIGVSWKIKKDFLWSCEVTSILFVRKGLYNSVCYPLC